MKRLICCLVVALMIGSSVALSATEESGVRPEASDEPIGIDAKKATFKVIPGGQETIFEGSVKVKQKDLTLTCDKLIVISEDKKIKGDLDNRGKKPPKDPHDASEFKSATALGNVQVVQNELRAQAGKAVFDNLKRTITLTEGPPRIWQGPHVAVVNTVIIYIDENRAEMLGGITVKFDPGTRKKDKEKEKEK